jgi:hypothetical protein
MTTLGLAQNMQVASIQKDELYQGSTLWVSVPIVKKRKPYKALALDLDMVDV